MLAALISFSRLYLTVHYPTDVLASVVFGSAYGGAAYLLMKKVLEKPGSTAESAGGRRIV